MTALVRTRGLVDSLAELFDDVDVAPIERLLAEYAERREAIDQIVAAFKSPSLGLVLPYLVKGSETKDSYHAERMFADTSVARAYRALDADYWQRAFDATDVLSALPAGRRDEWHKQLSALDVPPFTGEAVRSTLAEHLSSRLRYFAERVDGLFRGLSPDHKTNLASGFRSKMIVAGVFDSWHTQRKIDLLVDLRIVVARFMGRTDVGEGDYTLHAHTRRVCEWARAYHRGEWVELDGGAIEVRLYDNGNAHVRVHDEIAWRLNAVLASVNPGAIPESNRTRPAHTGKRKKVAPAVTLIERPLPFKVVEVLSEYRPARERVEQLRRIRDNARSRYHDEDLAELSVDDAGVNDWEYGGTSGFYSLDKHIAAQVLDALAALGGVKVEGSGAHVYGQVRFDYDPAEVLREVALRGALPDVKSHQYYPTPRNLAEVVVGLAEIGPEDDVLEPSAGQGGLAELLPRDRTVCVEASALHCAVLRAKGFDVTQGDFLAEVPERGLGHGPQAFDRVVMNPPFDRGQWQAHLEHAAKFVAEGGRLVAILPASAQSRDVLPGWSVRWAGEHDFPGTSIRVAVLVADRRGTKA